MRHQDWRSPAHLPTPDVGVVYAGFDNGVKVCGGLPIFGVGARGLGGQMTASRGRWWGTAAELLASDRALDRAWRGGVGVARDVARAKEFSEMLLPEVVIEDAKQIISARHNCDPAEAFARIVFVSHRTNRSIRDLAREV